MWRKREEGTRGMTKEFGIGMEERNMKGRMESE